MASDRPRARSTNRTSSPRPEAHRRRAVALFAAIGVGALGLALGSTPAAVAADADAGAAKAGRRYAPGRILVRARPGLSEGRLRKELSARRGRLLRRLNRLNVDVVEVPVGMEEAIAKALSLDPRFKFAEVDLAVPLDMVPNDQLYGSAWHLPRIQAPSAWDLSLGDGVTVAVLDTGVDASHPDLAANLVPGWNVASASPDTSDVNNHGTWVAGVVAALGNNALGVTSMAWRSRVMPIRVTNNADGTAWTSDIAAGLTWAADHGAKVANVSYGVSGSPSVQNAAQYFRNKGGVVCVSAGNSGSDPGYASNPYVISLSATNRSDTRTSWSSYGKYVDFAAPGEAIPSTARGGGYASVSGTSFSSPMTAGLVALMVAANDSLSPPDVEAILQNTADDLGAPGWDGYYGHGRINAGRAVQMAASSRPSDTEPPTAAILSPAVGSTVDDLVPVDVSAQDNYGVGRVELYVNGALVAADTTAPYQFSWDSSASAGKAVTLTAKAYDAAGNVGASSSVSVTVAAPADHEPPRVTITSPAPGARVSGTLSLSAAATDNVAVRSVSLYVDGRLRCSAAPSVSCSLDTRRLSRGSHVVSAKAADAAGNTASASVTVTR